MTPLVEKYRPQTLDAFAGMDRPRAMLKPLARKPYPSAWLLLGPSGLGKTTMALALAAQIGGDLHHVPSSKCDLKTVDDMAHMCHYIPMSGAWHVVLVDEADQMSRAAQLAFLSKLDTTAAPPNTIFIFTANETKLLADRFLSRCRVVKFTVDGLLAPGAALLANIWRSETDAPPPDFERIMEESGYNIRQALMLLEMEILAGPQVPPPPNDDAEWFAMVEHESAIIHLVG
jgi:replication-associated recombination protein RarA